MYVVLGAVIAPRFDHNVHWQIIGGGYDYRQTVAGGLGRSSTLIRKRPTWHPRQCFPNARGMCIRTVRDLALHPFGACL